MRRSGARLTSPVETARWQPCFSGTRIRSGGPWTLSSIAETPAQTGAGRAELCLPPERRRESASKTKVWRRATRVTFAALATRRAADPVDVLPRIIRGIKLDDPIDGRDVQTAGLLALHGCWLLLHATAACGAGTVAAHRHVCAQEDRPLGVAELKERGRSFVLFLLAVQVKARDVDVVQQLAVVFDLRRERTHGWSRTYRTSSAQQDLANGPHRVAGRKEHDDFSFFQVLLQEGEE